MFDITVPIVTQRGFLISTFQAGSMKFPEKCFVSMPKWHPIDFIKYCISDIEKMLSGEHDRACVPVWLCDFDGATVPSCNWGLNRIDSLTIGFNQYTRCEDEHFRSIHYAPEDWWKDVPAVNGHFFGTMDSGSIYNWLDFYRRLVSCADGNKVSQSQKSTASHFSLTPFMSGAGGCCVCGLRIPTINCDLVIDVKPTWISSSAYLEHWRVEMIKLLDGVCDVVVLPLESSDEGAVTKWIGMVRKNSECLVLSAPQEHLLEDSRLQENDSQCYFSLSSKAESVVTDFASWATVSIEDIERWIYWAGTVLSGISVVDDDPEIVPCCCGVKVLASQDSLESKNEGLNGEQKT